MLEVDETDADALRRSLIERVELLISNSLTTGEAGSL
jgi:hypothetical protein